ncbi:MAG: sulfurtransferase TusA family protein [Ardenticatenaceae bacterium]|nr:sulfurtransferase TusA family protein [Anaerolineales bacterium]MCB8920099.1 sulfurtransferase TusA family protein [Ardenticatenaceae bacterium]MCB8991792.1 sulfurtransferase TusA family protein [Ardenticatenaceae bacterium]
MEVQAYQPHKLVDFGKLRCPHLIIALMKTLHALSPGQILQLTTNELNAPSSITTWCRQSGDHLLDLYEEDGRFIFFIQHHGKQHAHDNSSNLQIEARKAL